MISSRSMVVFLLVSLISLLFSVNCQLNYGDLFEDDQSGESFTPYKEPYLTKPYKNYGKPTFKYNGGSFTPYKVGYIPKTIKEYETPTFNLNYDYVKLPAVKVPYERIKWTQYNDDFSKPPDTKVPYKTPTFNQNDDYVKLPAVKVPYERIKWTPYNDDFSKPPDTKVPYKWIQWRPYAADPLRSIPEYPIRTRTRNIKPTKLWGDEPISDYKIGGGIFYD